MTLQALSDLIESKGYRKASDPLLMSLEVLRAPIVMVPRYPAKEGESTMIGDILPCLDQIVPGMAGIELGAICSNGVVTILSFRPAEQVNQ